MNPNDVNVLMLESVAERLPDLEDKLRALARLE